MSEVLRVVDPAMRNNTLRRLDKVTAEGRRTTNLQGSYSFISGLSNGSSVTTTLTDRSSAGHNATLTLGTAPIQRAEGYETADQDGMVWNSNIALTNNAACIMSLKITAASTPTTYPVIFSPSNNSFPVLKTDPFGNDPHPFFQAWMETGHVRDKTYGILEDSGTIVAGRPTVPVENADASQWATIAIRITGSLSSQGIISIWTLKSDPWSREGGYVKVRNVALNNYFGSISGSPKWSFGIWPYGDLRPATGVLGLVDIYNTLLQTEIIYELMRAQAREMFSRGVTVQGYPYPKL